MTTTESTALARIESAEEHALMPVDTVVHRLDKVQELMKKAMKEGPQGDYGSIPGTGERKTLLKPGAEKLCTLFRLAPTYQRQIEHMVGGHREYVLTCTLTHIPTGVVWGQGEGSCTTMESKYRWRRAERKCPACGMAAIIKGKEEYGGGWLCYRAKGGCGAKYPDADQAIIGQEAGKVENPDIADMYNTVLKIATKRALVAAVLITTGASALFTQDVGDDEGAGNVEPPAATPAPRQQSSKPNGQANGHATNSHATPKANAGPPQQQSGGVTSGSNPDRIDRIEGPINSPDNAAQKWTRWDIFTTSDVKLSTFSSTTKDKAEAAMAEEAEVLMKWINKGKGYELQDILPIAQHVYEGEPA